MVGGMHVAKIAQMGKAGGSLSCAGRDRTRMRGVWEAGWA